MEDPYTPCLVDAFKSEMDRMGYVTGVTKKEDAFVSLCPGCTRKFFNMVDVMRTGLVCRWARLGLR